MAMGSVAARMAAVGVPLWGGHGVREHELLCRGHAERCTAARRARLVFEVLGDSQAEDVRWRGVDTLWLASLEAWWQAHDLPAGRPVGRRIDSMLAAMRQRRMLLGDRRAALDTLYDNALERMRLAAGVPLAVFDDGDRAAVLEVLLHAPPPMPMLPTQMPAPVTTADDFIAYVKPRSARRGGTDDIRWWEEATFIEAAQIVYAPPKGDGGLAELARATLVLLGSVQPRARGAEQLDLPWKRQVEAWFDAAMPSVIAWRQWSMLHALEALAAWPARELAGSPPVSQPLANALRRLCPLQPSPEVAQSLVDGIGKVVQRLQADGAPPRPCAQDPGLHAYLAALDPLGGRPAEWLGRQRCQHIATWIDAVRRGAQGVDDAALATLRCLGGQRTLALNWLRSKLLDAVHAWCVREVADPDSPVTAEVQRAMEQRHHVDLVLGALEELAGSADVDQVGRVRAARRGIRRLAAGRLPADGQATRHRLLAPVDYQPPGSGTYAPEPDEMAAIAQLAGGGDGPWHLYARLFLRVLHVQLVLHPVGQVHVKHRLDLYGPVEAILAAISPCAQPDGQACAYRECAAALLAALRRVHFFRPGQPVLVPGDPGFPPLFDPFALTPMPAIESIARALRGPLPDCLRVCRLALLVMDVLTDPTQCVRPAAGGSALHEPYFGPPQYRYLHRELGAPRASMAGPDAQARLDPAMEDLRQVNGNLFNYLGTGNLQHRIQQSAAAMGWHPSGGREFLCERCSHEHS